MWKNNNFMCFTFIRKRATAFLSRSFRKILDISYIFLFSWSLRNPFGNFIPIRVISYLLLFSLLKIMFDFLPSLVRFGTQVIQCLGHFVVGYKMTWVLNDLFSSKLDRQ